MKGLIYTLALLSLSAQAGEFQLKNELKTHNDVCKGKDCEVTKVFFHEIAYGLQDPGDSYPYYGTIFRAGFEAKNWNDIQDYGFVQVIRGCTYESVMKNGKIKRRIGEVIRHYDVKQTFVFPNWTYDANTKDPLYYGPSAEDSSLPGGRLALYDWTPTIGRYDKKKMKQFTEILELPESARNKLTPRLMVTDTPSMAYFSEGTKIYNNVALEFKMCLYRLKDIPLVIDDSVRLRDPIICHNWDSNYEFDFKQNKFVHSDNTGQNEFCASQTPKDPLQAYQDELDEEKK